MSNLLLRNVRPNAGEATDILVRDGKIAAFGKGLSAEGVATEDGNGQIVISGLVEAHTHLDKSVWGMPWHVNAKSASLRERIDFEREQRLEIGIEPHRQSMRQAIMLAANGASHIRSHVDIDTTHGLRLMEGIVETRKALEGIIDIEIVAFPQSGLVTRPGTVELLDKALSNGAEVLGGIDPCGIDRDPKGHLDAIFGLADKHAKPIDIHLHEQGELGAFSMEMMFERIRALGMQGKVAISHAFALGAPDYLRVAGLIEQIAELDIRIVTTGSPSSTVPSILRLKEDGVKVAAGCDGIRDTWGPWGQPDMMDRARILGMKNGLRRDVDLEHALHVCSKGGAEVMDIRGYGLDVGCDADFTLLTGETLAHAVVDVARRPLVVKRGRVIARNGIAEVAIP